jgi:hypothetical protein
MRWKRPYGKVDRTLGGAATYFSVAASFFTHVNLVGVVGEDFTKHEKAFFRGGGSISAAWSTRPGKTFFWAGRYGARPQRARNAGHRTECVCELQSQLPMRIFASRSTCSWPILIRTLQFSVLDQMKGRPLLVGLDTMNYWIESAPAELRKILKRTQVLMINDAETRMLSNEHNLLRAARHIFSLGRAR